jgi:phospholipase/lecithinase/hemolysin
MLQELSMKYRRIFAAAVAILSCTGASYAQHFSAAYVFGDSNVDSGFYKALPNPGGSATFNSKWATAVAHGAGAPTSNPSPMHSQILASYFGLAANPANQAGGTNYATSGAKNLTMNNAQTGGFTQAVPTVTQIANYLSSHGGTADPQAAYYIHSGDNDVNYANGDSGAGPFPTDPTAYLATAANDLATAIASLQTAGATKILVATLASSFPGNDPGKQALKAGYNQALLTALASKGVTFLHADINAPRLAFSANPGKFGFTAVNTSPGNMACTQPAGITTAWALLCSSDPAAPSTLVSAGADHTKLFADDQHLGTEGQRLIADYIYSRIPFSSNSPLLGATLPASRSVQVGGDATAFVSILNSSTSPATGCGIAPITQVPATFSYQTTDPATNTLTGSPNTPAAIAPGAVQSYLVAFHATGAFPASNVLLNFSCSGLNSAQPIMGVNTLLIAQDPNPVADMIAVGLTPTNDGYARTSGPSGTGLFVIAASNIGATTSLTARVRLLDPTMAVTPTLCETFSSGPQTGQCKAPPTTSVTRSIAQNENTTWSAFLAANGSIVQDPAKNRVIFEFFDSNFTVRGSTSTAITSQ